MITIESIEPLWECKSFKLNNDGTAEPDRKLFEKGRWHCGNCHNIVSDNYELKANYCWFCGCGITKTDIEHAKLFERPVKCKSSKTQQQGIAKAVNKEFGF